MNLDGTVVGRVIATLTYIAGLAPRERSRAEAHWQLMAETAITRLHRKIPLVLRDLDAHITITIGRLVPSGEAAAPADAVSGDAAPPEEKTDG